MGSIQADVLIPDRISSSELDVFLNEQFEDCENLTQRDRDRYLKGKFDLNLGRAISASDSFFMYRYDGSPEWQLGDYGVQFFIILRNKIEKRITIEKIEEIENKFGFRPQCQLFIDMPGKSEVFQEALSQIVLILAEKYNGIIGSHLELPKGVGKCMGWGWYNSDTFRNLLETDQIYFVP